MVFPRIMVNEAVMKTGESMKRARAALHLWNFVLVEEELVLVSRSVSGSSLISFSIYLLSFIGNLITLISISFKAS
jgi:hypothetical protein